VKPLKPMTNLALLNMKRWKRSSDGNFSLCL
jgi:hypothetical protein